MVDFRLAELVYCENGRPSSLEELRETARRIQEAHARTKQYVEQGSYSYPTTDVEFLALLVEIHKGVFAPSVLKFAGAFRTDPIRYGSGRNELEGTTPERIEEDLRRLHRDILRPLEELQSFDKERFVRFCARFLEDFFRIHPFADGNGRVGRLCLNLFAIKHGKFRFRDFSVNSEDTKDYQEALEFAHRHSVKQVPGEIRGRPKDPLKLLFPWLLKHLDELKDTNLVETPPKGQR